MSDFDDITPVPGIPSHLMLNMAKVRETIDRLTAQLAAMTAARDEACDLADKLRDRNPYDGGARERISQLRSVGSK